MAYPTIEELRAEDEELPPSVFLVVRDDAGQVVRRIDVSREKGVHRATWDLRYPTSTPVRLSPPRDLPPWISPPSGPLALPGTYTVAMYKEVDGVTTELTEPQEFQVVPLEIATFAAQDLAAVRAFQSKVAQLQRAVLGAGRAADETQNRLAYVRRAIMETPDADPQLLNEAQNLSQKLNGLLTRLNGDRTKNRRNEPAPPSITSRVENVVYSQWTTTAAPTQTEQDAYRIAGADFVEVLAELRKLNAELVALEDKLESAGAPWTPGRIPEWQMDAVK